MSATGQTRKSLRATGKSASPSGTDIVYRTCQVRNVPLTEVTSLLDHLVHGDQQ